MVAGGGGRPARSPARSPSASRAVRGDNVVIYRNLGIMMDITKINPSVSIRKKTFLKEKQLIINPESTGLTQITLGKRPDKGRHSSPAFLI